MNPNLNVRDPIGLARKKGRPKVSTRIRSGYEITRRIEGRGRAGIVGSKGIFPLGVVNVSALCMIFEVLRTETGSSCLYGELVVTCCKNLWVNFWNLISHVVRIHRLITLLNVRVTIAKLFVFVL